MQHLAKYRTFRVDSRKAWGDGQEAQIDFILASQDWFLHDTWIDQNTHAATDHRPVCVELSTKMQCAKLKIMATWRQKITETLRDADLEDWTSWAKNVSDTANENRKDTNRSMDPDTCVLLALFKTVS